MIVQAQDLVKRYGALIALDHFSLSIQAGEIYGLLGPNGCGKSTLINCLLSLLRYEQGEVRLFGEKMTSTNYGLKKRIGLVMQDIGVYQELTAEENIAYFCSLYIKDKKQLKQYVNEAIDFVQIGEFRKFRPKKLSGGLLRRLNLACGIAHKPELIILDEPTVAIDPQSRNQILEGIKELSRQGRTVLYTTHYMEEVELLCDRLTIMDKGKELVHGTQSEIRAVSQIGETIEAEIFNLPEDVLEDIRHMEQVKEINYNKGILIIHFGKGQSQLIPLLHYLNEKQVEILNLNVKKPTLNDIFLEITGKELRDHV